MTRSETHRSSMMPLVRKPVISGGATVLPVAARIDSHAGWPCPQPSSGPGTDELSSGCDPQWLDAGAGAPDDQGIVTQLTSQIARTVGVTTRRSTAKTGARRLIILLPLY